MAEDVATVQVAMRSNKERMMEMLDSDPEGKKPGVSSHGDGATYDLIQQSLVHGFRFAQR